MSFYQMGAQTPSTDYLPVRDLREGITLFGRGVRRGQPGSLYKEGIRPTTRVSGAMLWLQSFVMDIIHIVLLIAGGFLILNAVA